MIRREPASIVVFNPRSHEIRVCRWYPIGKRENVYPISALSIVEVETTEHTDGGSVYRPRLRIGQSEFIPVSVFWYQTMKQSEGIASEIRHFLNISPNKTDAGDSQ